MATQNPPNCIIVAVFAVFCFFPGVAASATRIDSSLSDPAPQIVTQIGGRIPQTPAATDDTVNALSARKSLGKKPSSFGSRDQAKALLALIDERPGSTEYQINYSTGPDVVIFSSDLQEQTLSRLHIRPDGSGSTEQWQGYILHRLNAAASGGSLDDTPAGKQPGTFNEKIEEIDMGSTSLQYPSATDDTVNSLSARKSLGKKPSSFGSSGQAKALLALIDERPSSAEYHIDYSTDEDVVIFGCNLQQQTLSRFHLRPDDSGTAEQWQGKILFRLKTAALGGSLNDTPTGKKPGTFNRF